MKKGDVGIAKCFSKKYRNKGCASTTCNPKVTSRCLSVPDATSLHHCLKNKQLKLVWFQRKGSKYLVFVQLRSVWLILAYD